MITAEANQRVPEDRLIEHVAGEFRVSPALVHEIYTGHADEIARRLQARAQARSDSLRHEQEARQRRCGPLPARAWDTINRYVQQRYAQASTEIVLGECMSARLSERECWEIRCDYQRKVEVAVELPKQVTRHNANFYLANDRVTHMR